jgi:putative cytoplasmic protein
VIYKRGKIMKKREIENMEIVKNVIDLLENARKKVVMAVNQTMVLTYVKC